MAHDGKCSVAHKRLQARSENQVCLVATRGMEGSASSVIRALAESLATFGGGAPASVLQHLEAAGTPADILAVIAQGAERESIIDSASSVPRSAHEAHTAEAESQYSNNELMDGLKYISNQVQSFENHVTDHCISGIMRKLKKLDRLEVDIQEMKTTLRMASGTVFALEKYLTDSAAAHRSDVSQIANKLVTLQVAVQTMLKKMHTMSEALAVEHRIMVEMAKPNRS